MHTQGNPKARTEAVCDTKLSTVQRSSTCWAGRPNIIFRLFTVVYARLAYNSGRVWNW